MLRISGSKSRYLGLQRLKLTAIGNSQRRRASTSTGNVQNYDAVIIGGGPVGLALGCALNASEAIRTTQSVALIEASDLSKVKSWALPEASYSNRISSITNASVQILSRSGALEYIDVNRTNPIQAMQVWDGISDARIHFHSGSHSLPDTPNQMAVMIENLNLQRALLQTIETSSGLEVMDKVKVESIVAGSEAGDNWPVLHLSDGRIIRARLLIGADGFNSPVKGYAKIPSYGWTYDTHAIVATLEHHPISSILGENTTAFQRFLHTGPIAFLPLSPTISSLVWSTTLPLAKAFVKADPQVLVRLINAAFRLPHVSMDYLHDRILETQWETSSLSEEAIIEEIKFRERSHDIDEESTLCSYHTSSNIGVPPARSHLYPPLIHSIQSGTIASFPLRFSHSETYLGEGDLARTVLLGDAAHTIHPLAGQGLNMGLGDVDSLVRCIENAAINGGDIGSRTTLLPYARERYLENHMILSAVDKLHKLYSTTASPIVWARSVGLEVANELDTLKAAFMMSAGATSGVSLSPGKIASGGYEMAMKTFDIAQTVLRTVGGVASSAVGNLLNQAQNRQ